MSYRTDLFDKATVEEMLAQFETLLAAVVADPDRRLSGIRLASCGAGVSPAGAAGTAAPQNSDTTASSLAPLRTGGTEPPLFCIHGLGGHVAVFLPLATALAEGRPVFGLQGRGLDAGQTPHDRIDAMAGAYIDDIRTIQPAGPYLLAGWSLGGLIAIEAAHQLLAAGDQVALLAMFDTHLSAADFEKLDLDGESVLPWIAPQLNLSAKELQKLPLEQQWERIADQAKRVDGVGIVEIQRLAEVCKAHLVAASCYEPAPYLGPAVLFQADMGPHGVVRRWQSLCPRLQVERVPGNHYSMLRQPDVNALAQCLDRHLARLAAAGTPTRGAIRGNDTIG
jgi:thioesterase domain-containing protein